MNYSSLSCSLVVLLAFSAGSVYGQTTSPTNPFTPPTVANKTKRWLIDSFGPGPVLGSAISAGFQMLTPPDRYPREWRDGGGAFGRNFGTYYLRSTAGFAGRYVASVALKEDTRYHPSQRSGLFNRSANAIRWVFVDQSDSGHARLALANFAGALSSGYVARPILPNGFEDNTHALQFSLISLGGIAIQNFYDEFKPELRRGARKFHIPIP